MTTALTQAFIFTSGRTSFPTEQELSETTINPTQSKKPLPRPFPYTPGHRPSRQRPPHSPPRLRHCRSSPRWRLALAVGVGSRGSAALYGQGQSPATRCCRSRLSGPEGRPVRGVGGAERSWSQALLGGPCDSSARVGRAGRGQPRSRLERGDSVTGRAASPERCCLVR